MIDTSPPSPVEAPTIGPQSTSADQKLPSDVGSISASSSSTAPAATGSSGSGSPRPARFLLSPTRSSSFTSPKPAGRPTLGSRAKSFAAHRRSHEVDGRPLPHWDRSNFEPRRDATCRVVYEPKDGATFFRRNLDLDDYHVMRSLALEQPYFSKYVRFFPRGGHFCCKACGNPLYAHSAKFDASDGWPAFGACVDGAVGIIPAEERNAQIRRENEACVRIQAFIRGVTARAGVSALLEGLIRELLQQREQRSTTGKDGADDEGNKDDKPSSESDQQQDQPDLQAVLLSPTKIKLAKSKAIRYTLLRALGDDYTEIHCHRCKSHLGDVLVDENRGRNGQEFRERHRVNGRALKYVEDDLPKRMTVDASLLFANQSQRRLLGLPEPKRQVQPNVPLRTAPFVSPRAQRASLSSGVVGKNATGNGAMVGRGRLSFDPLSVSCHELTSPVSTSTFKMKGRRKLSFDPLSVSCHEWNGTRRGGGSATNAAAELAGTASMSQIVAARRGAARSAVNIQERRAALEDFILSKSVH